MQLFGAEGAIGQGVRVGFVENTLARIGLMPRPHVMAQATSIPYVSRFAQDNHLAHITLDDWLGALPDHVTVTRDAAMRVGAVAAARHIVAGTLGRLPLYLEVGGIRAEHQPRVMRQLERGVPLSTTLTWAYDALMFWPCTWFVVRDRDAYGWPRWYEWIAQHRADIDDAGNLAKVDGEPVAAGDVVRVDSPLGHGLLHNARKDIQRAIALNLSAALAEDNPVPTVELHNESGIELTNDEREQLLTNWSAARRKRGVAYTPKGLKVIAHGTAPEQLLIDGRRAIALDLIRHANLPAWAASTAVEGATMTYDNRAMRNWELIDLTLAPYMKAFADRFSMNDLTPRGSAVRVDTSELTQPDQKTRFETYALGKQHGFIDNAWIAAQEGWATVPKEAPRT